MIDYTNYRSANSKLHRDEDPPEWVRSDLDNRRWATEESKLDARDAAARKVHPAGKQLYAQSRAVPQRRRAGIDFSNRSRTEVTVVDEDSEAVAARVALGQSVVSPLGASALLDDDGLTVFEAPLDSEMSADRDADYQSQLAAKDAELAEARAQLAGLRKARKGDDPDAVTPTRLTKSDDTVKDSLVKDPAKK